MGEAEPPLTAAAQAATEARQRARRRVDAAARSLEAGRYSSGERLGYRAALAAAAQHVDLAVGAPSAGTALPAGRRALGVFFHQGVAVTVTPTTEGRPGLPVGVRARASDDQPSGRAI